MARVYQCDICKKNTTSIVAKLFLSELKPGNGRSAHSQYSYHADVGICCKDKILQLFNFRPRMTREEYIEERRRDRQPVQKGKEKTAA